MTASKSLRVMAFTGGATVPAARFRVRQYVPALASLGVEIDERPAPLGAYPPRARWLRPAWAGASLLQRLPAVACSHRADVTLLQRELLSTLVTLEGWTRRPRVLDVDDAIHLFRDGRTAERLARACDLVVCGNNWLAEVYAAWNARVAVLPTAVDTTALPATPYPAGNAVIGWIGTSGNLRYLEGIEDALAAVLDRFPRARLAVCADLPPTFHRLPAERVDFVSWSPAVEAGFFADLNVGLMPLTDSPWERGKCGFKMLQYLCAGRPAVVSPIGMNTDVLAHGDVGFAADSTEAWVEALSTLLADPGRAAAMGRHGRAVIEEHYAVSALAPRLAGLLRGVA
ncbi:MAG TPA: glycosyltransferase family 4 protein [Azospirillum sp.]|nr:glycosyltransferase family 4 protein [Azospirillum sp.]